jgi:hypothetical protein
MTATDAQCSIQDKKIPITLSKSSSSGSDSDFTEGNGDELLFDNMGLSADARQHLEELMENNQSSEVTQYEDQGSNVENGIKTVQQKSGENGCDEDNDDFDSDSMKRIYERSVRINRRFSSIDAGFKGAKIAVLYCGGTIGMKRKVNGGLYLNGFIIY